MLLTSHVRLTHLRTFCMFCLSTVSAACNNLRVNRQATVILNMLCSRMRIIVTRFLLDNNRIVAPPRCRSWAFSSFAFSRSAKQSYGERFFLLPFTAQSSINNRSSKHPCDSMYAGSRRPPTLCSRSHHLRMAASSCDQFTQRSRTLTCC